MIAAALREGTALHMCITLSDSEEGPGLTRRRSDMIGTWSFPLHLHLLSSLCLISALSDFPDAPRSISSALLLSWYQMPWYAALLYTG